MSRKKYIMLSLFVIILLFITPFLIKTEPINSIIDNLLFGVYCIYSSYLLIYKKSYNLLAGMTEELAEEIKNNPEEEKKIIKTAKILGYIFIILALLMLVSVWFKIK